MLRFRTFATAAGALLLCGIAPATAGAIASEKATLTTSFSPDRLGASTTIGFSFSVATVDGLAPPPLTDIVLHMPAGMNYTDTNLGLAICEPEVLQKEGLKGCPVNSRLGSGSAFVEVPFGDGAGHELPEIQAVMGPSNSGNIVLLFYANGQTPVSAQLVFKGEVQPASGVFGSQLATAVPAIPSVPDGPNVAIISVKATIGPQGITYYKHVHGRRVAFRPTGIGVPESCPRGGFPFSAEFTFEDGSTTSTSSTVPCPPAHRSHHKK
ncbi:MAG TPA: hypothetical protein VNV37_01370 [Solirubrobacteraceae bacterium]|jgi:hypothetical protein|nr:hypothetical protein [Solirubrobacteraceae bacterium]